MRRPRSSPAVQAGEREQPGASPRSLRRAGTPLRRSGPGEGLRFAAGRRQRQGRRGAGEGRGGEFGKGRGSPSSEEDEDGIEGEPFSKSQLASAKEYLLKRKKNRGFA